MAGSKFGVKQLKKQTPAWALWTFRIVFALVTIAIFVIAGDPAIPEGAKVRIGVYLKAFEMFILILSKFVGVTVQITHNQDADSDSHV